METYDETELQARQKNRIKGYHARFAGYRAILVCTLRSNVCFAYGG
jgi:hypothetical protein